MGAVCPSSSYLWPRGNCSWWWMNCRYRSDWRRSNFRPEWKRSNFRPVITFDSELVSTSPRKMQHLSLVLIQLQWLLNRWPKGLVKIGIPPLNAAASHHLELFKSGLIRDARIHEILVLICSWLMSKGRHLVPAAVGRRGWGYRRGRLYSMSRERIGSRPFH